MIKPHMKKIMKYSKFNIVEASKFKKNNSILEKNKQFISALNNGYFISNGFEDDSAVIYFKFRKNLSNEIVNYLSGYISKHRKSDLDLIWNKTELVDNSYIKFYHSYLELTLSEIDLVKICEHITEFEDDDDDSSFSISRNRIN